MTDELAHLWALHGLDEEAVRIRAVLARYPEERAAGEQRVKAERARLETQKQRHASLQKERRELERQAEAVAEEERKFQGQLPQVKKNEEYQALLHEIERAKSKRSDLETQILEKLDEEESVDGERPAIEKALHEFEDALKANLERLTAAEAREKHELETIDAKRAEHMGSLSPSLKSRYERTLVSREGRAVVPILKGACSGCFRGQAPQVLQEAKRADRVIICDGCGRMLIWPPEA